MIYINAYELDGNLYSIVKTAGGNTNGAVLLNVEDGEPVEMTFTVYPYDCLSSLSDNKAVAALSELLGRDASDVRKSMKRRVIMATVDDESGYTDLCASDVRKYTKTGLIRYAGMVDNPFSVAYDIIVTSVTRNQSSSPISMTVDTSTTCSKPFVSFVRMRTKPKRASGSSSRTSLT